MERSGISASIAIAALFTACRADVPPRNVISVLVFERTDCPISNKYAPELRRIAETFAPKGVKFFGVYPGPRETEESAAAHTREYALPFEPVLDPQHALVAKTGARVTPEAAVFSRDGRMIYRGRIDDRFVAFGQQRPEATTHELEDAIRAALEGGSVRTATKAAVGCYIGDLE